MQLPLQVLGRIHVFVTFCAPPSLGSVSIQQLAKEDPTDFDFLTGLFVCKEIFSTGTAHGGT